MYKETEIALICMSVCLSVYLSVYLSVCLPLRALITNDMICYDVDHMWLVKQVSRLFCFSVALYDTCHQALVIQHVVNTCHKDLRR